MGERERGNIRAPRTDARSYHHRSSLTALILVACPVLWLAAQTVHAIPLSTLQQGGSVTQGDKLFTNFQVSVTGTDLDAIDLDLIDVVGYTSPSGEHGIIFQPIRGDHIITVNPGLYLDVLIRFDVFVQNPQLDINDLTLSFVASAPEDGHAQVVETALTIPPAGSPEVVGQTFVSTPIPDVPESHIDLIGQHHALHVIKDVAVIGSTSSTAPGADSTISQITQTFSQIPEPTTLVLLAAGSVLLAGRRRALPWMGRSFIPAAAMLALLISGNSASAVPLSTLAAGESIVEGDKEFSNFAYTVDQNVGQTIFDASSINVSSRTQGQDVFLAFEGLFAALSTVDANSLLTVTIDFDVQVTDPGQRLSSLGLFFNGQPLDPLDASASVVETVTSGGPLATLTVQNPGGSLTDNVDLPPPPPAITSIHVSKTITVNGGDASVATISIIEQRFTQIPEPATLAGLTLGAPLILRLRRRGAAA